KFDFGFFSRFIETLESQSIAAQVDSGFFLELIGKPIDYFLVNIAAAQMRVAVGRFDFNDCISDFQDRNVECSSAKVEYGDFFFLIALIKAVCQSSRSRLVD